MPALPKEVAYEILSLPTFATPDEIILRYKQLAIKWYPERNGGVLPRNSFAMQNFKQINEALLCLLKPERHEEPLKLVDLYQLFHSIFFGNHGRSEGGGKDKDSADKAAAAPDEREIEQAAVNASKLILEEEQEKLKAERKKAKKKRRKERKKQQKAENENLSKQNVKETQISKSKDLKGNVKDAIGETSAKRSSDSEEAIDTESAFVAVIAKKHRSIPIPEPKRTENSVNPLLPNEIMEDPVSVILRSRQLAMRANEMASMGHYMEAIDLFSESIKLDPSDHRFYGNRSYCYDRLGDFERALKDAEKSVALCPSWPKGYYRKGKALLGLKKYAQAEESFVKVLKIDNDCDDAISELHKVKVLQIMELGYSMEDAETALAKHSSVHESIESLLAGAISKVKTTDEVDEVEIFMSDEESDYFFNQMSPPVQLPPYDIKMDPRNPENHNSLWIGNVQPDVGEKKIYNLFSKYGELLSVKVMPEKFCAFVNYKNRNAPGRAMQAYQGLELHGANLIIKFPNLPGEVAAKKKLSVAQESSKQKTVECYYWRTTGCIYGENCRNRHVKEHKGIDKKKWHGVP